MNFTAKLLAKFFFDVSFRQMVKQHKILKRKRSRFLEETSKFCQNSTLHGIGELYRADNKTVRVFWMIIVIGAFGASIYGCYAILDQYMEAPVIASYIVTQPSQPTLRIPDSKYSLI
uniref:Uncharacterized protein n=1 Tax=Romanomermis culicivorax TaxID=13658 RepID=A0A915IK77_ROMCU